jgi:HD-GYP domain-containing protein (c-di-GMP phosphodiesterase class II)
MREARRLLAELLARPDLRPLMNQLKDYDGGTYRHSLRVARFALVLARGDGFDDHQLRELAVAAMMHDLGKVRVDPGVVRKPGPLDERERDEIRRHPAESVDWLRGLEAFPEAHRIAPLHHELQGPHASYPRSGNERRKPDDERDADRRQQLPLWMQRAGQILALADRYDALISRRPYKDPWPDPEVRTALTREMPDVAPLLDHLRPPDRPPR